MSKLNLLLLAAVAFVAVLLISSEHKARRLNMALDEAATSIHLLDAEYAKLQADAGVLGVSERVANIAIGVLKMRQPDRRVLEVHTPEGSAPHAIAPPDAAVSRNTSAR